MYITIKSNIYKKVKLVKLPLLFIANITIKNCYCHEHNTTRQKLNIIILLIVSSSEFNNNDIHLDPVQHNYIISITIQTNS